MFLIICKGISPLSLCEIISIYHLQSQFNFSGLVERKIEEARSNKQLSTWFRNLPRGTQVNFFEAEQPAGSSAVFQKAYFYDKNKKDIRNLVQSYDNFNSGDTATNMMYQGIKRQVQTLEKNIEAAQSVKKIQRYLV